MSISYQFLLFAVTGLALVESSETSSVNCTDVQIKNGPLITPCVTEIILQKGQNFTLTCKGATELKFRQQEVSEEVTSNFTIVNTSSRISEKEYNFQRTLDLYNVDQYAIGYYACSDDYVDDNVVNTITEEPENDEHVSYIYVYVNGTDSLFAPMRELIMSRSNKILIECRPTTPDVEVKLYPHSNIRDIAENVFSPKVGFTFNYVGDTRLTSLIPFSCDFRTKDRTRMIRKAIYVQSVTGPPEPIVTDEPIYFMKGEQLNLNCTVQLQRNTIVTLQWKFPKGLDMDEVTYDEETNSRNITEGTLYNCLKIYNASKKHEGNYTCVSSNTCESKVSKVVVTNLTKPFLEVNLVDPTESGLTRQKLSSTRFEVKGYPKPTYKILKNGNEVPIGTGKYNLVVKPIRNYVILTVKPLDIRDNGNYTLVANNTFLEKSASFKLEVGASPVIDFGKGNRSCVKGTVTNLKCDVTGYPLPVISWLFTYDDKNIVMNSTDLVKTSDYGVTAYLKFKECENTGTIICNAGNKVGNSKESRELFVYEIIGGFGIDTDSHNTDSPKKVKWFLENARVTVKCFASIYEFYNVTWLLNDSDTRKTVEYSKSSKFSYVAELKINGISKNHTGNYNCSGVKKDGTKVYDSIQINVLKIQPPVIIDAEEVSKDVFRFEPTTHLNCIVTGAPLPEVKWFKDDQPLEKYNHSNIHISNNNVNLTAFNSTVIINGMQPDNAGKYECRSVSNNITTQTKSFTLKLKVEVEETNRMHYVIGIIAILLVLVVLIVYLSLKMKKEKRLRKELMAAGLWDFKHPLLTTSLNPDLGIDEQAELLPYDEKFEFPPEKLILGKQLGAGAFGVVYKGEARGIVNAEETTPVAVKMVKKTAENMYIKALASELKIMVHLGKHINIVNLLGACTKNVAKRELLVIVEYCKYGNIHNYMQRHREVFIDQLDTDNKEKLGKVNRAYTSSSCGSSGAPSDYFGSTNTRNTDHTFLNTENTAHSTRKNIPNNNLPMEEMKASEGYVQPEWRSNYESDYSYDGRSPRPLTSRDLLAWAFQIARGMEYLASRKVLHGDLAARNVLLADDNVVKICDFGLAKSIYKNDEYQKKENSPLPVKWLAIECMTDRIFSTQSDVWSFGIVLWEIFTLAKTPYPNIPHTSLLQFLSEGHRLEKPVHADDKLYDVMKNCWEAKPTLRPTFSQLQEKLGTFLEDNVREHYVDLNSTYDAKNAFSRGQEDYLDMIRAPDYNNMVTPSPHHYVNANDKSFFPPTPVKVDEEGYLQISPANQGNFSPRVPNTEFDFDPRKFNSKASEASCGSELTPMLTLNNLPARSGSESDHEGNPPYLNACPRIDEEADEVFVPSLNDTKNAKNVQQSAVTNPTYITFDNFDEKPKDIINSYVNINMPNGLVK